MDSVIETQGELILLRGLPGSGKSTLAKIILQLRSTDEPEVLSADDFFEDKEGDYNFDPTKIKFEELKSELPNSWYVFVNSKDGKVKFGAIDQNKMSINGSSTPFKLRFSTIGDGVNILTSVKVSPTMDASDSKGVQLGINLNSTQIKLTGYNNF